MNRKLEIANNVRYGGKLKLKLTKQQFEKLNKKTMRSEYQTNFLYNLLDGNYDLLCSLEEKIRNHGINYCPSTIEEVKDIIDYDTIIVFKKQLEIKNKPIDADILKSFNENLFNMLL